MYFVAPGEKIILNTMNFIHIQNKYKQSKLYFYFSTVPAKDDKETKYRKTKNKNRFTLNIVNISFVDMNKILETLKLTLFKLKKKKDFIIKYILYPYFSTGNKSDLTFYMLLVV